MLGGGGRIRTIEENRNRFTVCPLWPLGNSPLFGASCRSRTNNLLITSQLLCHWANEAHLLSLSIKFKLATQKGLEPSTSGVTGRHSNQLSYWAAFGGNNRDRTCDPLLVRQMLSQLSYASVIMVTPRGIEPLLPPWKGGVLTAWPRGLGFFISVALSRAHYLWYLKL